MKAIFYDIGRYLVESESGEDPYLVDIAGRGQCDCIHFRIRVDAQKTSATCKHICCARAQFEADFDPDVRANLMSAQKKQQ